MRAGLILFLCVGFGCAGRSGTPEGTAQSFARAVRDGRYEDAYERLSKRYRQRVPLVEFRQQLEAHPDEARELAALLDRAGEAGEVTATVPLADGADLSLRLEDGRWRIHGNVVDFYDQSSPRAALRSFVRAMERRRYEIVLRFVPNGDREGMSPESIARAWEGDAREEIQRLVASLRANLDEPIEVVGDRATMAYGEGATVQFLREDGVWKIEDPD